MTYKIMKETRKPGEVVKSEVSNWLLGRAKQWEQAFGKRDNSQVWWCEPSWPTAPKATSVCNNWKNQNEIHT